MIDAFGCQITTFFSPMWVRQMVCCSTPPPHHPQILHPAPTLYRSDFYSKGIPDKFIHSSSCLDSYAFSAGFSEGLQCHSKDSCRVHAERYSGETGHPCGDHAWSCLTWLFWEQVFPLCATDSLCAYVCVFYIIMTGPGKIKLVLSF